MGAWPARPDRYHGRQVYFAKSAGIVDRWAQKLNRPHAFPVRYSEEPQAPWTRGYYSSRRIVVRRRTASSRQNDNPGGRRFSRHPGAKGGGGLQGGKGIYRQQTWQV